MTSISWAFIFRDIIGVAGIARLGTAKPSDCAAAVTFPAFTRLTMCIGFPFVCQEMGR